MNRMIRTAIAMTYIASLPALAQEPAPAAPAPQDSAPAPAPPAPASPDVTQPGAAAKPAPTPEQNAEVMSAISNLSPIIGDVQIVGPWVEGERNGVWRTIMTQALGETKGSRFFFQQVEEREGKPVVVASTEVTEIAEVDGAIVGYRADAPAEGQESNLTLFFDIVPLDGEISETYELFVAPGQPYRFGPASN
ncbi:hypothetical protein [Aureimonas sp. AU22]|uniref:hypothetical protein n=1 Tax=Aureimonas sp. AU22 TaxID=1638162 RepID=UPI00070603AA|nr:hypothetical protein [Aureimonas sp. AU22]BAT30139.1 DNA topoisomerase IV subunit B [Aureimonas sp. AU22]